MRNKTGSDKDMMVIVKSDLLKRAMVAEARKDTPKLVRCLLAAAYLEQVIAVDFSESGEADKSLHSRLSAASCFWRAGRNVEAIEQFDKLQEEFPERQQYVEASLTRLKKSQATARG